jgi:hypothetical protein
MLTVPAMGTAKDFARVAAKNKATAEQRDDVEARIKKLHAELVITPEQEAAWQNVAQVMRENAKTMDEFRMHASGTPGPAPNVIAAYAKTMEQHADGILKFATTFQSLYDGMSDEQKKTADEVFRYRVEKAAAKRATS